jgi:hypothetical protein
MKEIFEKFRLNHNQKLEAKEIITELQMKNPNMDTSFIINFQSEEKQIANSFINFLRELRYPQYSLYSKTLSRILSNIHNENPLFRIIYNDNFESDTYEIVYLENQEEKKEEIENMFAKKEKYLEELHNLIKGIYQF